MVTSAFVGWDMARGEDNSCAMLRVGATLVCELPHTDRPDLWWVSAYLDQIICAHPDHVPIFVTI